MPVIDAGERIADVQKSPTSTSAKKGVMPLEDQVTRQREEELATLGRDLIAVAPAGTPLGTYTNLESRARKALIRRFFLTIARDFLGGLKSGESKDDPGVRAAFWAEFTRAAAEVTERRNAVPRLAERREAFLDEVGARLWARAPPDVKARLQPKEPSTPAEIESAPRWGYFHAQFFLDVMGPVAFSSEDMDEYWRSERTELLPRAPPGGEENLLSRYSLQSCVGDGSDPGDEDALHAAEREREATASALLNALPPIERAAFGELIMRIPRSSITGMG